jgi:hypothetical protein
MASDKLTSAEFYPERMGLTWIKTRDKDMFGSGDFSEEYDCWLLVEQATDRMIVSIDAPYPDKLCYVVAAEGGAQRRYISLDGAKRFAVGRAMEILQEETVVRACQRKARRLERILK